VLEERSGYFKIQRRESGNARDGKRSTFTTSIAYAPSSSTELLFLIGELKRKMADLGIGLYASHALISGSAEDEATGGTNWNEVAKRYEANRVGTGQVKASTYEREERRRIERTIELIYAKGRGAANDGQGVMRN
jgi:hypothetical protein